MKRSAFARVETVRYSARNLPVRLRDKLGGMAGMLGSGVSEEMVLAMAVEFGLEVMQGDYVLGVGEKRAREKFMRDFRLSFWEEVSGDE